MHRTLTISEILYRIFIYFQWQYDDRTLARLARTCKTFKDPALDLLWEFCFQLQHLIRVLPHHAVMRDSKDDIVGIQPLTTEEWTRFHAYSARVREVSILEWESTPNPFITFLAAPPAHIDRTFPKLRRILIQESKGQLRISDYHFLLGPFVECVDLRLEETPSVNDALTESIIRSVPEVCPKLTDFSITWYSHTPPPWAPQAISETVVRLDHLKTLQCPAPNSHAIMHISQLPSLVVLVLNPLPQYDVAASETGEISIYNFASLYSLQMTTDGLNTIMAFLRRLKNLPDAVTIDLGTSPQPSALEIFFGYLDNFHNRDFDSLTLRKESSQVEAISDMDDPGPPITLQTLRPLLQYDGLYTLDITVTSPISLTDADIRNMSLAWPNLRTFALNESNGWGGSTATIESLYSLVENCPSLNSIGMSIDASQLDEVPEDMPADGYYNDELMFIRLGDSRIGDPAVLALVLATVFTSKWFHPVFSYAVTWKGETLEIQHHLSFFECIRQVREMEEERIIDEDDWPPPPNVIERLRQCFQKPSGSL